MIFLDGYLETILECGYHGCEIPDDPCFPHIKEYTIKETKRYEEEGIIEVVEGHYRLTKFGEEALRDWFQLQYESC